MEHHDELLARVRACTVCEPALPSGARPILQMHPGARVLLIGQAPGRKAHEAGIPFDDPSGERLRDWLGIDRERFYDPERIAILPMGFCYPGRGRTDAMPLPHPSPLNYRWMRNNPWFETELLPPLRERVAGLMSGESAV